MRQVAEGVVEYVGGVCAPLREAGESTAPALAYAYGSLTALRAVDLLTEAELVEWLERVAEASGEDEPFQIGG